MENRTKPRGAARVVRALSNSTQGITGAYREEAALSGLAKDIGSGAVLMAFLLLAVIWTIVLTDR